MSDWLTWQIVDSAFPTGAFAHSWGLEAAWQHGEIRDAGDLRQFLQTALQQATFGTLPLVNAAYREPNRLEVFDARADAFLVNRVANRASRIQGRTVLATVSRVWPSRDLVTLSTRVARTCAHAAPLTGVVFGAIGLPLATIQQVVLFGTARSVLAAAVRLGISGSYEAQQLQAACGPWFDDLLRRAGTLDVDDLVQVAPLADILQARHDRLYSRLFQS
jgi:urease accessory protein